KLEAGWDARSRRGALRVEHLPVLSFERLQSGMSPRVVETRRLLLLRLGREPLDVDPPQGLAPILAVRLRLESGAHPCRYRGRELWPSSRSGDLDRTTPKYLLHGHLAHCDGGAMVDDRGALLERAEPGQDVSRAGARRP